MNESFYSFIQSFVNSSHSFPNHRRSLAFPLRYAKISKYRNKKAIAKTKFILRFFSPSIFSFLSFFFLFFFTKTRQYEILSNVGKIQTRSERDEKFGRAITQSFIQAACQSPSNGRIFYLSREGRPDLPPYSSIPNFICRASLES